MNHITYREGLLKIIIEGRIEGNNALHQSRKHSIPQLI